MSPGRIIAVFAAPLSLIERVWNGIRWALHPVVDPLLGPLARRIERWEERRLLWHRDEDLALADRLDTAGLHEPAERLRGMYR